MWEENDPSIQSLRYPEDREEIVNLKVGRLLRLSGIIVTARDKVHRLIADGELSVNWQEFILMHAGPVIRNGRVIALGPTTSTRMANLMEDVIRKTGVRVIIGKGGLGKKGISTCKKFGCVYLTFTGGASALGAKHVSKIIQVEHKELGETDAIYYLEVRDFGPLVVTVDRYGNDLYAKTLCLSNALIDAYLEDV